MDLTVEQAINEIENEIYYMQHVRTATNHTKKEYALLMAKVALSKEIPKVPYIEPERGYYGMGYFYNTWICPHCKQDIEPKPKGNANFSKKIKERCRFCGGVLIWEKKDGD